MTILARSIFRTPALAVGLVLPLAAAPACVAAIAGQAPAASPMARQIGTVKTISGNNLTLATDAGAQVAVTVVDGARVLQLEPGSTDLKSAKQIGLSDVAVGDRVLVTGKAGDNGGFSAARVILMKSSDIAQKHEEEQADWQKRGSGGLVTAVDPATGAITITAGSKKVQVATSGKTQFRRYSGDSVKFEDAKPGTLSQIQAGDQVRVLGDKSEDGSSITADVIVSGTFKNLSGTIASINAGTGTLTLKDLATKKMVTVKVTDNSNVRKLPEKAATMLAARAKGGAAAAGTGGAAQGGGGQGAGQSGSSAGGQGAPGGPGRQGGGDLSQMLARFPTVALTDLKVGDAVMIVGSQPDPGNPQVTAVTMLAGVEPLLAASPSGSAMTLSPWSVGGGAPEGSAP